MIIQTAGVGTTLGRAVNTFKLNIRAAGQIMLIPLVVAALEGVVNAIPSAVSSLTIPAVGTVVIMVIATLLIFVLSMVSIFITVLFSAPIIRINYSSIVRRKALSIAQSVAECKKRLPSLVALTLYGIISMIVYGVVDAMLAVIAMIGISALMVATTQMTAFISRDPSVALPFMIALLVISGALVMIAGLAIVSFQMMLSFLPLVYNSVSRYRAGFAQSIGHAVRMLFANLPRAIVFGMLLIIFWSVLAAVLQLPFALWVGFELRRFDSALQPGTLPLHVSFVGNLITSVAKTVMTPFGLCALAFFWYDCQVRKEGADLSQWLARMQNDAGNGDSPSNHEAA